MTASILAVYENGLFRPMHPLNLREGETVQLTITPATSRLGDDEFAAQLQAAKSLDELFAIVNVQQDADDDYDLCQAMDENRRQEGALPLFPPLLGR